ncbi:MAG: ATP-grasp fold amidoligase family protein [Sphaerochaetaceae bacterium]|nr:ATP-grasp fold amidoligase family protein [Sphaerochaetaceae bacterium]
MISSNFGATELKIIQYVRFFLFKAFPISIIKLEFYRNAKYWPNLRNPQTLNEKLTWLKLNWRDDLAKQCADKSMVRKYVADQGLSDILLKSYGIFHHPDDIDFSLLPDECMIKVSHGCGQNIHYIKGHSGVLEIKRKLQKWIKESHYVDSLEWIYETKRPSILIEEFIKTDHLAPPNDYKIFCFNGKPAFLFVASDRGKNTTKFDFFDLQWNHLPVRNHYPNSNQIIKKPEKFKEMLKYASILSKPFPQVRIDFYYEKGKIYFGEMTFFHFSGNQPFEPGEWDLILGEQFVLSF